MIYDFDFLIEKLNYLDEETSPKWGKMNSFQMINHCNNFIEVSLGNQKISLWTRLFGRLFGKVFLKYLKSLDFDINKYPKNSKTLKEFKSFSSEESFLNKKNRLTENIKIVKELKERGEKLTFHNINEYLFRHHKECTYFNTTMVMNILNLFKPKRWLDCSAGWGDRLVGAIAYDCEYVGVDPSKCMRPKYKEIIKTLASPSKQDKYKVICDGFENVKIKKNYFDLVFTSPPFFDFEVYENNNNQSVQQFNTVDKWKKYFLFPLIDKSYLALRVGGYLALYITDFKGSPYIKDMKDYVKNTYKNLFRYEGDLHFWYKDSPKKIRIIYVWKKIN